MYQRNHLENGHYQGNQNFGNPNNFQVPDENGRQNYQNLQYTNSNTTSSSYRNMGGINSPKNMSKNISGYQEQKVFNQNTTYNNAHLNQYNNFNQSQFQNKFYNHQEYAVKDKQNEFYYLHQTTDCPIVKELQKKTQKHIQKISELQQQLNRLFVECLEIKIGPSDFQKQSKSLTDEHNSRKNDQISKNDAMIQVLNLENGETQIQRKDQVLTKQRSDLPKQESKLNENQRNPEVDESNQKHLLDYNKIAELQQLQMPLSMKEQQTKSKQLKDQMNQTIQQDDLLRKKLQTIMQSLWLERTKVENSLEQLKNAFQANFINLQRQKNQVNQIPSQN